jgi:hypothetical protein
LQEDDRFLPVMFCSPTMELGVDISALNAVYLRISLRWRPTWARMCSSSDLTWSRPMTVFLGFPP